MNELRRDPISGRWSIIIKDKPIDYDTLLPHRPKRRKKAVHFCPFCEGNESLTGPDVYTPGQPANPGSTGWQVRVVSDPNPVLERHGAMDSWGYGIFDVVSGIGVHELLIEHPKHSINYQDFSTEQMQAVLQTMKKRIVELKDDVRFRYVLIHKNYGESSANIFDHTHSHILATPITPRRIKTELDNAKEYFRYKERCLYCDMIHFEMTKQERIVEENGTFMAVAPFASHRPFEIWILPEEHEPFFEQTRETEDLAEILISIMGKIYRLLNNPDYILTFHNGPNTNTAYKRGYWKTIKKDFHWHIEIVPRLHNLTGFELGSGFSVNPVQPELAAKMLREETLLQP